VGTNDKRAGESRLMLLGHIDLVDRHVVRGWAADTDRPYGTLEVAVFVDGNLAGLARADKARDDLKDPAMLGAGVHGVSYKFDPPLAAHEDHDVVVRFAEGGRLLGQWRVTREINGTAASVVAADEMPPDETRDAPTAAPPESQAESLLPAAPSGRFPHAGSGALPDDALIGFVDTCTLAGVEGWAASETNPDEVLDISVFVDDRKVAQIKSDQPRKDLAKAGIHGDGARGFAHIFDPPLPKDRQTRVTVTYARTGTALTKGSTSFVNGKATRLEIPEPLGEDEPRLLPVPSDPRALFDFLGLYEEQGGLGQLLSRLVFEDARPEQIHYSAFGIYPTSLDDVLRWGTYYGRDHLHQLLLSDEFQTQLIPLILRAFPEKRRLMFVHIPKCAGTDLTFHFRARFPSLDRSLTDPQWTEKPAMLRRIARVVAHLHASDSLFVHGHINLADHIAAGVIRPTDRIFTIIRDPLQVAISQINYVLTRFDEDMATGKFRPDTKEWADVLDLGALPSRMSDDFIKRLTGAALRHEDLVLPNSVGSWLGGEGAQAVIDRLAQFNVEVTDTSRYSQWLLQGWRIDARTRWNESKKFLGLDDLTAENRAYLNSITTEDQRIYRTYQQVIAATGKLSVTGDDLRGVVVR